MHILGWSPIQRALAFVCAGLSQLRYFLRWQTIVYVAWPEAITLLHHITRIVLDATRAVDVPNTVIVLLS